MTLQQAAPVYDMKPKAKTLLERMGFQDPDLTTAKHDEILLWLKGNIEVIINELLPEDWSEREKQAHEKAYSKARFSWIRRLKPPLSKTAYIYHRGGILRFGKLTMSDADLEIVGRWRRSIRLLPKGISKTIAGGLLQEHRLERFSCPNGRPLTLQIPTDWRLHKVTVIPSATSRG